MNKIIIFFFLLSAPLYAPLYADMHAANIEVIFNNESVRDMVYDFVVLKSSNYTRMEWGVIEKYNNVFATNTVNSWGFHAIVRFPWNKQSIFDELKNKMNWFKNNFGEYIVSKRLAIHTCWDSPTPCTEAAIW